MHVFGHVHEQPFSTTNGQTLFINAAICSHRLDPRNNPILFDLNLPEGIKKWNKCEHNLKLFSIQRLFIYYSSKPSFIYSPVFFSSSLFPFVASSSLKLCLLNESTRFINFKNLNYQIFLYTQKLPNLIAFENPPLPDDSVQYAEYFQILELIYFMSKTSWKLLLRFSRSSFCCFNVSISRSLCALMRSSTLSIYSFN